MNSVVKEVLDHIEPSKYIKVLHDMTCCNTVSALYRQDEAKAFKMLTEGKLCERLNNGSTRGEVQIGCEKFL